MCRDLFTRGYTTTRLAAGDLVTDLRSLFHGLDLPVDHQFHSTCNDLPRDQASIVQGEINAALGERLGHVLPGYRPFLAGFISKGEFGGPATAFHQDLTYTDERVHRAVLIWMTLIDLDGESGGLRVVEGSHRWTEGLRPSGLAQLPTAPFQEEFGELATTLRLSAGEAVIYDAALIHGAAAHPPGTVRPAVAVALAPEGAQLVRAHSDDRLRCYRVADDYYLGQGVLEPPEGSEPVEPWAESVDEATFRTALTSLSLARQPAAGTPDGDHGNSSRHSHHRWSSPKRRRRQRVLIDRRHDRALARQGFVTFPFLDGAVVSGLRQRYGVMHGWDGEGFEPDLTNPDLEYRRSVDDTLAEALDGRVSALFHDHEPFMRVFLCKWIGENSDLYIHRDWMYTDERQGHRTYVVWVALQDVVDDRGVLQVVPGSHLLDPSARGTNLNPPWMRHQDVLRDRLRPVPVRAGDAIVFDNQLIHASLPNTSDQPRLVAAIGTRHRNAPLVHFRKSGEEPAERFDVDENFFLTDSPITLLEGPPDLDPVERFEPGSFDLESNELAAALDSSLPRRARFSLLPR